VALGTGDRTWIESKLPHQGRMCLLDEVMEWDAARIVCRGASHRAIDHPLRYGERLGIACAIEYAAQAIALHGALCADEPVPRMGYLASVRDVRFGAARFDDIETDLLCSATRLAGDSGTVLYEFQVAAAGGGHHGQSRWLVSGRATIAVGRNSAGEA